MDILKSVLFSILERSGGSTTLPELLVEYENQTGMKLPYREFGYETPFSLVANLTDVRVTNDRISLISGVAAPTGNPLTPNEMFEKRSIKTVPSTREDTVGWLASTYPSRVYDSEILALFEFPEFRMQWFSDDECNPGYKFPPLEVPHEWLTVEIVDAYSPTEFWVHTRDSKLKFHKLMDKLNDYYQGLPTLTDDDQAPHELPIFFIPGLAVCAYYLKEWVRAVTESMDHRTGELELFCVDYGSTIQVKPSNVRKLHRMFSNEAMLAIKASLANVRPPEGEWSMESYSFMYNDWSYMRVSAKIVKIDREVPQIEVYLFSDKRCKFFNIFTKYTNKAGDLVWNINELLVECQYAVWIKTPHPEELSRDKENAKLFQESEPPEEEELPEEKEPPEEEKRGSTDEQGTSRLGEKPCSPPGTCAPNHTNGPCAFLEELCVLFKSSTIADRSSDHIDSYPEEEHEVIIQHIPTTTNIEESENGVVCLTPTSNGMGLAFTFDGKMPHSGVKVEQKQFTVEEDKVTTSAIDVLRTIRFPAPPPAVGASSLTQHGNSFYSSPGQSLQIPEDSRLEGQQRNQTPEGTLNEQIEVETAVMLYGTVNFLELCVLFKSSTIADRSSDHIDCYPEEEHELIIQHIPTTTNKEESENGVVCLTPTSKDMGLACTFDAKMPRSGVKVEQKQFTVEEDKVTTSAIDVQRTIRFPALPSAVGASSLTQHYNSFYSNPGQSPQVPEDPRLEDQQKNQTPEGTLNEQLEAETAIMSCRTVKFSTVLVTKNLHVFKLNEHYLVSKDELFELTKVLSVMASYRYKYHNLKSLEIHVSRRSPELWELLRSQLAIDGDKNDFILVHLQNAAKICKAIHPSGRSYYEESFKRLMQQLPELFQE